MSSFFSFLVAVVNFLDVSIEKFYLLGSSRV